MESLPHEFKAKIAQQTQENFPDFLHALQQVSPTSIRMNSRKNKPDSTRHDPVPWSKWGAYLRERPVFTLDPHFHGGKYYVQEASSMFLERAVEKSVDLTKPLRVLDLCAAPGGKSTHLLSLLNEESLLVSNEVIRSRSSILSENIQKWGYPNILVTSSDPEAFSNLTGFFDLIVIDAPCSGEGLFRKDPMAVSQWSPENVALCSARQKRILHDVWPALKEEGVMIYCTCTYNESENEDNLDKFGKDHPIEFIDVNPDPSWNIGIIEKGKSIGYRFFPHKVKGEGFFLSAFRKKESAEVMRGKSKARLSPPSKKQVDQLSSWIHNPGAYSMQQHQDLIFLLPKEKLTDIEVLLQHLKFVYGGVNLATAKHEKLIPEHALALSTVINRSAFSVIEVDEKKALQYLRRESISLDGAAKGFTLLSYQNTIIGWVNVLDNRVNNMYPQEWRIRMAAL